MKPPSKIQALFSRNVILSQHNKRLNRAMECGYIFVLAPLYVFCRHLSVSLLYLICGNHKKTTYAGKCHSCSLDQCRRNIRLCKQPSFWYIGHYNSMSSAIYNTFACVDWVQVMVRCCVQVQVWKLVSRQLLELV